MISYRPFDGDAWLGRELYLIGGPYQVAPESVFDTAQAMAYARQGRKSRVFKLLNPDGQAYALKTFHRGFSLPEYAPITESLQAFGDLAGLRVCQRRLVTEAEAAAIGEPGLAWAVLMPWIEGVAWAGVVEQRFALAADTGAEVACRLAAVLAMMEANGLAHADISSSNVLVIHTEDGPAIELIDVEYMYHEQLPELPFVPDGSAGYAHPRNSGRGCRNPSGDRFAGAVLLAEVLVWPDPAVRAAAADVSVFNQSEVGRSGAKFDLVRGALQVRSPELAQLFERAWDSPSQASCPRLAEWHAAMGRASAPSTADAFVVDGVAGTAVCPGCGRAARAGLAVHHAPQCPLRSRSLLPDKSSFPGVPVHDNINFMPLFDADQPM